MDNAFLLSAVLIFVLFRNELPITKSAQSVR
jgi:hypothetical protein